MLLIKAPEFHERRLLEFHKYLLELHGGEELKDYYFIIPIDMSGRCLLDIVDGRYNYHVRAYTEYKPEHGFSVFSFDHFERDRENPHSNSKLVKEYISSLPSELKLLEFRRVIYDLVSFAYDEHEEALEPQDVPLNDIEYADSPIAGSDIKVPIFSRLIDTDKGIIYQNIGMSWDIYMLNGK